MASKYDISIAVFSAVICIYLALNISPSILVTDEIAYSLMAHTFAKEGSLEIWNGLNETVSWELNLPSMDFVTDGQTVKLYGIPAPLYTFLAYPFYQVAAVKGLMLINILSFGLIIILVYQLGKLFMDERLSAAAALTYALFTNALSFTNAILPHMLSTCLILASVYLVFRRVLSPTEKKTHMFAAGFIGGLSIGVRFTDLFFVCILVYLIFQRLRRENLYAFSTGLMMPLIVIAIIDLTSYSNVLETSYGNLTDWIHLNYVIFAVPVLVGYWLIKRKIVGINIAIAISAALCVIASIVLWDYMALFATTLYARIFDLALDPSTIKVDFKKALLQSTPLLIMAVFSTLYLPKNKLRLLYFSMFAMILINMSFYSTLSHGGNDETLSMRYFLEFIPFLVILSIKSIHSIFGGFSRQELVMMSILFLSISVFYLHDGQILYSLDKTMRAIPAVVSLLLFGTCILYIKLGRYRSLCLALIAIALAISISYSYGDWDLRSKYYQQAYAIESLIRDTLPDGSAIFTNKRTDAGFMTLTQMSKHVRVVDTEIDGRFDTPRLVDFYVNSGIPVYYYNINNINSDWVAYFENISSHYPPGSVKSLYVSGNEG